VGGILVKNVNLADPGSLQSKNVILGFGNDPAIVPFPIAQDGSGNPVDPELVILMENNLGEFYGATKLSMRGRQSYTAVGTVAVTASSTAVSGTGTFFKSQVGIGDRITVLDIGQTRTVVAVNSDTSLTVDTAFTTADTSSQISVLAALLRLRDSSGNLRLMLSDEGKLGIGTPTPADTLSVVGSVSATGTLTTGSGVTVGSGGSQGVNAGSYSIGGTEVITINRDLGNLRDATIGGAGRNVGFYGGSTVAKQTVSGSREVTEEALKNLLSALASLGLITDSTST